MRFLPSVCVRFFSCCLLLSFGLVWFFFIFSHFFCVGAAKMRDREREKETPKAMRYSYIVWAFCNIEQTNELNENEWTNEQQQIGWSHTLSMKWFLCHSRKKNRTLSIADYVYGLWGVHYNIIHTHTYKCTHTVVHSHSRCVSLYLVAVQFASALLSVFVRFFLLLYFCLPNGTCMYECVPRLPCSCLVNHKHINIQSPLSSSWSASTTKNMYTYQKSYSLPQNLSIYVVEIRI